MTKMKMASKLKSKLYKAIFVGEKSLIQASDEFEFQERKLQIQIKFQETFDAKYLDVFTEKLLKNVKEPNWKSGGKIPVNQSNNDAECLNSIFKRRARRRKIPMKLSDLVSLLILLYQEQENYTIGIEKNKVIKIYTHYTLTNIIL